MRLDKGKKLKSLRKAGNACAEEVEERQAGSKGFSHGVVGPDKSLETSVALPFDYQIIELIVLKELEFPYQSHTGGRTKYQAQEELVHQEGNSCNSSNLSDHLIGDWSSDSVGLMMGRLTP